MAYCSKCGTKLEDGDIYCPNCGTRRMDIDDNTRNQSGNSKETLNVNVNFKAAAGIFINMFLKPVTTAKKFINEGKKDTVILLTIFIAILQGLFGIWKMNQISSNINNIIIQSIKKIFEIVQLIYPSDSPDSISGDDINEIITAVNRIKSGIKIPYGEIFLENCIVVLIAVLTVFVLACLANALFSKNKPEIFKFYKTSVIIAIPTLYFEFFSIMFSYLSIGLGLLLGLFGITASIVCLTIVINESLMVRENYTLFIVSFIAIITGLVIMIFFQKVIPSTVSSIVSSIINSVGSLNL